MASAGVAASVHTLTNTRKESTNAIAIIASVMIYGQILDCK